MAEGEVGGKLRAAAGDPSMYQYSARFQCFAGCDGDYPIAEPIYRCPKCDGLLAVKHDMNALRDRSAAAWKGLFDERYMRTAWPYGSGV